MPKTTNSQWYVEQVAEGELHGHALRATLAAGRSSYQQYAIVESALFGKMLVLDGDTQSAELDEAIYHEALVHPAAAQTGTVERALVLGGAEGATLRELLKVPELQQATMVDIDGEVVTACRRYMPEWSAGAFEDPRVELIVGDAAKYVRSAAGAFDVIIADLTEPLEDSPSYGLHTLEFYRCVRRRLKPGGVFALQASTSGPHNWRTHARMIATLRGAFSAVLPYSVYVPSFDTDWGFALCGDGAAQAGGAALEPAVERYVARCAGLRHYDGETHRRMFSLPRYLREAYALEQRVFSDRRPVRAKTGPRE